MYRTAIFLTSVLVIQLAVSSGAVAQEPELVGIAMLPGSTIDLSGLDEPFPDGTARNHFGGISAIEFDAEHNRLFALSDRGPADGEYDWPCRLHELSFSVQGGETQFGFVETKMLTDEEGRNFTGRSTAYEATEESGGRFDPEGIRFANGNFLVSDEYGPQLFEFNRSGQVVARHEVPEKFLVKNPGPDKKTENANNETGRTGNRGMEGIAVSGNVITGMMQSPLLQDCKRNEEGKPRGVNTRIWQKNTETGEEKEFVYVLDHKKFKLHEIIAINDDEFLVIEDDGETGSEAGTKKVYRIDLSGASDVSGVESLPAEGLPEDIVPVTKTVFIDMLDERFGLANSIPEKIEGLSFGPTVNGNPTLLIASDNDFEPQTATSIWVFSVPGLTAGN